MMTALLSGGRVACSTTMMPLTAFKCFQWIELPGKHVNMLYKMLWWATNERAADDGLAAAIKVMFAKRKKRTVE